MKPWKTLSRTPIIQFGKFLTLETHSVELPGGRVIEDWPWVITPDFINVAAVTSEGGFLVFRQVKYGVEGDTLAPVGGYLEPGEDPLAGAQRELLEETGYAAPYWQALGAFRVDPNRGAGMANLFLARGARQVAARDADDLEEQHLLVLTRAEVQAALAAGEFKVLAWMAVMELAIQEIH